MALELAENDPAYEDIASKFFEHFVAIAEAMNTLGGTGLWDEQDGFYYDQLIRRRPGDAAARCGRWSASFRCSPCEVLDQEAHRQAAGLRQAHANGS